MNTVAKILIVVNLVLAGAFLGTAANFLGHWQDYKEQHAIELDAKDAEIGRLRKETSDLKGANLQLSVTSQKLSEDLGTAQEQASQMKAQNDLLKEAFNEASTQNTSLSAALEKAEETNQSNRQLIDTLQQERAELAEARRVALDAKEAAVRNLAEKEIQFENLSAQKQALESRVADLQQELTGAQLTAETAISRLGGAGDIPLDQPAHQGQVLSVDNRANVVIISLGAEDGVKPGFRYTVSRGSQYVGRIEITDVQSKQSAGRSIKSLEQSAIQRRDRVMSR